MDFVLPTRPSKWQAFTVEEKLAVLDEYDKCLDRGSKVALSRALGVRDGTLRDWFLAREAGRLVPRGRHAEREQRLNAEDKRTLKRVLRENELLKAKLAKSEAAVDILGKASALLEAMAKSAAATDPHLEEPEPGRPDWLGPGNGNKPPSG
jgi:transposase